MKKTLAFLAALTFAVASFTACGGTDDDSKEEKKSKNETSSVSEEKEETKEETKDESEAGTDGTASAESAADSAESSAESTADSVSADVSVSDDTESFDFSGLYNTVDAPSSEAVEADEAKFVGKWECYCMEADGMAYDEIMGIPLYAMLHIELNADKTGIFASMDDPTADSEGEQIKLTWEIDGSSITITAEGEEEKLIGTITKDGYLMLASEDESDAEHIFMKSVTEYTEFDATALEDMFGDLSVDTESDADAAASTEE